MVTGSEELPRSPVASKKAFYLPQQHASGRRSVGAGEKIKWVLIAVGLLSMVFWLLAELGHEIGPTAGVVVLKVLGGCAIAIFLAFRALRRNRLHLAGNLCAAVVVALLLTLAWFSNPENKQRRAYERESTMQLDLANWTRISGEKNFPNAQWLTSEVAARKLERRAMETRLANQENFSDWSLVWALTGLAAVVAVFTVADMIWQLRK